VCEEENYAPNSKYHGTDTLVPFSFPVDCHVFVAALGQKEMVQNRGVVFCDNSVALLCKKIGKCNKITWF
jgi:hypothetical protein